MEMWRGGEVVEVLVVDDASTDDTSQTAERHGARVIATPENQGPGAARNLGAGIAQGEIIWFVDADVKVNDTAARILAAAFRDSILAAVVGSYDDRPPAGNFFSQYKNLAHHHYHHQPRKTATGFWSGCGAITARSFADIGGYDAKRFPTPSIEDIEFGYRLGKTGAVIKPLPGLTGTHLKVWRARELLHTEIFKRALPWSRLMLEGDGLVDELNVSIAERARAILAFGLLVTLMAGFFGLSGWWLLGAGMVVLIANQALLSLFARVNGPGFALAAIGFHQVYYLYSSAAFLWAWLERLTYRTLKQ